MSASAGTSMTAAVGSRARLGHEKRQLTAFFIGRIAGDFGDMLVPVRSTLGARRLSGGYSPSARSPASRRHYSAGPGPTDETRAG